MTAPTPSLENLLKQVSRSFYLSLKILPTSVRDPLALGYLLCRSADTIADTEAFPSDVRRDRLKAFHGTMTTRFPTEESLNKLFENLKEASSSVSGHERTLLELAPKVFAAYEKISRSDQAFINDVLGAVTRGMIFDLETFNAPAESPRPLAHEKELEAYLHWIGGEPGRFWTKVCLHHLPSMKIMNQDRWMEDGIIFGTGLQMVNILRDLPADLKNGRCYLPLTILKDNDLTVEDLMSGAKPDQFLFVYHKLIDQTLLRLQRGLAYIEQIPPAYWRLRAAVWWPLILGIETLALLRMDPTPLKSGRIKVGRNEVYKLLFRSLFKLGSNGMLRKEFSLRAAAASSSSGF